MAQTGSQITGYDSQLFRSSRMGVRQMKTSRRRHVPDLTVRRRSSDPITVLNDDLRWVAVMDEFAVEDSEMDRKIPMSETLALYAISDTRCIKQPPIVSCVIGNLALC